MEQELNAILQAKNSEIGVLPKKFSGNLVDLSIHEVTGTAITTPIDSNIPEIVIIEQSNF